VAGSPFATRHEEDLLNIPERINARWIATLADDQLVTAESQLHALFFSEETTEKARRSGRYTMLEGPTSLINAWHRWRLVSNETTSRGLAITHRKMTSA
jgi:hypothetical protein